MIAQPAYPLSSSLMCMVIGKANLDLNFFVSRVCLFGCLQLNHFTLLFLSLLSHSLLFPSRHLSLLFSLFSFLLCYLFLHIHNPHSSFTSDFRFQPPCLRTQTHAPMHQHLQTPSPHIYFTSRRPPSSLLPCLFASSFICTIFSKPDNPLSVPPSILTSFY